MHRILIQIQSTQILKGYFKINIFDFVIKHIFLN